MHLSVLVFIYIGVLSVGSLELPRYIPKCSLSDPNINQCIMEKGNQVIPRIVDGDARLAIPSVTPSTFSEVSLNGDDLEIQLFDVYTDDVKNFRLTNVSFAFIPDKCSLDGHINYFTLTGENYNILSGNVVGIPAYGNGKFVISLVEVSLGRSGTITPYQRDGETYVDMVPTEYHLNVTRAYYYFENIRSPCVDDVNAYIEENWEEFTRQLIPGLNIHFSTYLNYALHIITSKVPLNKIFLP